MSAFASLLPAALGPYGGLISAGILGGSTLAEGLTGSNAAQNAADAQVAGEQQVGSLVKSTTGQAQGDITGGVAGANSTLADYYGKNLALLQPYMSSGTNALGQLNTLVNNGGFKAPTATDAANMPGYQFQLAQGEQAVDRSAAAQGTALSGGQLKASDQYAQGLASTNYGNAYNQALGTYQNNFGNLQSLAGLGLSATNTGVGAGTSAGSQSASTTYGGGLAQAQNLMQGLPISADALTGAANARASGYVGSANSNINALNNLNKILFQPAKGNS